MADSTGSPPHPPAPPERTGLLLGAHVDQRDPVAEARVRRTTLVQFFLGDPQSYKKPEVRYPGGAAALRADAAAAGLTLIVHAPYLINVAATNNRIRIPSRKLLQQHMDAAAEIGAAGLVVHGGHVAAADDPEAGFANWRKAVDYTDLKIPLLIENTAGGGNAMSREAERIGRLFDALHAGAGADQVGMVGFCLDTCHAHAGGIPLEDAVEVLVGLTGRLDLVHANDSRDAFGSGADRHTSLGAGHVDHEAFVSLVKSAAAEHGAPVLVETPGPAERHLADFAWLRARL